MAASDDDLPKCPLPPRKRGAKPKPRKRAKDPLPKGKVPAPKRKTPPKADTSRAREAAPEKAWDPAAEARAAKEAVYAKGRKATVPIDPPIERARGKRPRKVAEVVETLEPGPVGGKLKRSRKTVETIVPAAEPAPATAKALIAKLRGVGRPRLVDDAVFDDVCFLIANGVPLRQICRFEDMPSKDAVYSFLDDETDPVAHAARMARYRRARMMGNDDLAEEALEIVDDGTNDYVERERDGDTVIELDRENIQRSKLRFEGRLKLLSKWDPNRYGERLALSDPDGRALGSGAQEARSVSDMAIGIAKLMEAARREREEQGVLIEQDAAE